MGHIRWITKNKDSETYAGTHWAVESLRGDGIFAAVWFTLSRGHKFIFFLNWLQREDCPQSRPVNSYTKVSLMRQTEIASKYKNVFIGEVFSYLTERLRTEGGKVVIIGYIW